MTKILKHKRFANLYKDKQLLKNIIEKHERYFKLQKPKPFNFTYLKKNLTFHIPKDGFNPKFGKISKTLLDCFLKETRQKVYNRSVLDLGCGAGFYALVVTSAGYGRVLGVDCSTQAISTAKSNRGKNEISSRDVEFRLTNLIRENVHEPFNSLKLDEHFDYTIANMPFTNERCGRMFRQNPQYVNYVTSAGSLFQMLTGVKHLLKRDGEMFMSFGKSGYEEALEHYCEVLGLSKSVVVSITEKDEQFFVLKIIHAD